jgi:hypothetical protein
VFCTSLFVYNTTQKTKDWATITPLKTNSDLQNITQKCKDWATRSLLKVYQPWHKKLKIDPHEPH